MTYKHLIETIEIIRKYDTLPDCYTIWATYEEFGFEIKRDWNMSAKDIRRLAEMGWSLGSDDEYDEENKDFEKWENYKNLSDEELISIFKNYNSISIFV